jgi:hypothetical protein
MAAPASTYTQEYTPESMPVSTLVSAPASRAVLTPEETPERYIATPVETPERYIATPAIQRTAVVDTDVAAPVAETPVQAAPDIEPFGLPAAEKPSRPAPLAFAVRLEPGAAPATPEARVSVESRAVVEAPTPALARPAAPLKVQPQEQVMAPMQPVPAAAPEAAPVVEATTDPAPAVASEEQRAQNSARALPRTVSQSAQQPVRDTAQPRDTTQPAASNDQPASRKPAESIEQPAASTQARERSAEPAATERPAAPRKDTPTPSQTHTVETRPATEMQREPRTAQPAASASVTRVEPEPAPQVRAAGPAKEISLQVGNSPAENVQVRVVERSGEVHVAVRAADERMAESLRGDLNRLSRAFDQQGYQAETWQPAATASGDVRQELQHRQGGNPDAWKDASENGRRQQQDTRQQQNRRETPRWVAELEENQRGDFRSNFSWTSQE